MNNYIQSSKLMAIQVGLLKLYTYSNTTNLEFGCMKTNSKAIWEGTLKEGKGTMSLEDSKVLVDAPYSFASRFKSRVQGNTNPEELIGAAHAGCFSMFLGSLLEKNGTPATRLETTAEVTLGDGPAITDIALNLTGTVPNITKDKFEELAKEAKSNCPVTKALAGVGNITLNINLVL